jgi:ankyrin repeat protein
MTSRCDEIVGAVWCGDLALLQELLPAGASCDCVDVLHTAAQQGVADIIVYLLDTDLRGQINDFDSMSLTPLMWEVKEGHLEAVKLLLVAGADVNAHEEARIGNTALREAAECGSLEMVDVLLKHGADPTIPGWMQLTALDQAAQRAHDEPGPLADGILKLLRRAK